LCRRHGTIFLKEIVQLIVSILIAQAAGIIGAVFTFKSVNTWYRELKKPALAPPGSIISAVWIILYTLMGTAAFLVWRRRGQKPRAWTALALYKIQLFINALWSAAFFGLRSTFAGLGVIALLWVAVLATTKKFWKISRVSGLLLVPYLIWVTFAACLNFSIWRLNR
jgi:tryptophan-rich sensory protein